MIPVPVPNSKHGLYYVRCSHCGEQYRVTAKDAFGERCCQDCDGCKKSSLENLTERQLVTYRKMFYST